MKRLKIILQSKYFVFSLILLVSIISFYRLYNDNIIYKNSIIGKVKNITYKDDKVNIYIDNVLVTYYDDIDFDIGDIIRVDGVYNIPSNNTNFHLFNYNHYLKGNGIKYIIKMNNYKIIKKNQNILYGLKKIVIKKINASPNKEYLKAFLLGDKSSISEDITDSFTTNGISHLFAISGMHVSLLSSIIFFIINKIKKSDVNYLIVFSLLLIYSFLVNNTPSILRSVFFFLILFLNKKSKLNLANDYLVLYLFLIFILINPFYIYNIGFIYSFTISYFLIRYGSITNNKPYIIRVLITSFIAFIASLPISINNYFSINLISIINNIIFVPFVSFILFPLILLSFFLSFLNPILHLLITLLESLSLIMSRLDFNLTLCYINIYIVILYYIIIIFILEMLKRKKYYYFLIIYLVIFCHHYYYNIYNELHMLDVGQGDAILLRLKNKSILIDTGGIKNYSGQNIDLTSNTLLPYLKSLGLYKLDYLILTHGDYDHMGESINLVNNFNVHNVILNCGDLNELETNLISLLEDKKINYNVCIDKLKVNNYELAFINGGIYDNENDNSNVIYLNINNYKLLLMGDASKKVETSLISKYNLHDIDVLKVGHHGSKTSSSKEFIDFIKPKYSLISVGKNNRYNHPAKETINNLASYIYRTDEVGSIMFRFNKTGLKIKTCIKF